METFLLRIIITFVIFALTACRDANIQTIKQNNIIPTDTIVATPAAQYTTIDTIEYDKTIYPVGNELKTKVLTTGDFHEEEVWQNADKEKWFGLFKGSNGFYVEQITITTKRIHDPIVDENENAKTGWKVSTFKKDSNYILIENLPFLSNRRVQHFPLKKCTIYPDDTLSFSFLGTDYKLFATGGKKKVQEDPEAFDVWNYKLYLTAKKLGHPITQLLVAQPSFDDKMIDLIFVGDIDGDEILDLIIDTSSHYNMLSPTLYLSNPADKQKLVTPVGAHTIVGC